MPHKDLNKRKEYQRKYHELNSKKVYLSKRKWYLKNKDKVHAQMRKAYKSRKLNNPEMIERHTRQSILKQYSLTIEKYDELHRKQGHRCSICKIKQSNLNRKLMVDHDHKTGKVRGLLCLHCNSALGYLKDNPITADIMKNYILLKGFTYSDNKTIV